MSGLVDVIVVGSGPSGAQAAKAALEHGFSVTLIDVGREDTRLSDSVPDLPFDEIRRTDPDQWRYFLGDQRSNSPGGHARVGSQLTPPRRFLVQDVERYLPFESSTFFPLQTLALGGLGGGWGAGAHTFEDFELREAGLSWDEMEPHYRKVADDIGISGARDEDIAPMVLNISNVQPPLDRDTNGQSILDTYSAKRGHFHGRGLYLGKAPAAILSQPLEHGSHLRRPNPYHDMEFYSDSRRSVYRPRYTIEELVGHPRFEYRRGLLAVRFDETPHGVRVVCDRVDAGGHESIEGRRLALAAGAINSARIVLSSRGALGTKVPLLCNPYNYIAATNVSMLGRPVSDRRHSLGQLTGVLTAPGGGEADRVILSFYSYRSLLLFRLAREMPLPTFLGVQLARVLLTSLTILGVHHVERRSPQKWLELHQDSEGGEVLRGHYQLSSAEAHAYRRNLRRVLRNLFSLRCVPLSVLSPAPGSSIHYAGTLPIDEDPTVPLRCGRSGKLNGTRHVYLVDSSPWKFLPAKGPTFTQMANARRVVGEMARELVGSGNSSS